MGVGSFPIQNPTVGGGSAFNDIVAQMMSTLAGTRAQRAQVGGGLFSDLLGAETAARRRPVNIVDQLLLASEFGSVMPLSQVSGERLSQLGGTTNPALGQLFGQLTGFAQGAIPQAQVVNLMRDAQGRPTRAVVQVPGGGTEIIDIPQGQGVQTIQGRGGAFGLNLDDVGRLDTQLQNQLQQEFRNQPNVDPQAIIDYTRQIQQQQDIRHREESLGQRPQAFQRGGSLVADPRRALSTGAGTAGIRAAGPVSLVDRNQQTVGVAGEGARPERLDIQPLPVGLGGDGREGGQGSFSPETRAGFDRDVGFRLDEFMRQAPGVDAKTALGIAQRPGDFMRFVGAEDDPRAVAARLLGGGIQSDVRFQDPLVRALSLGQAPTSAMINAQEFAALPPDLREALVGIIGEEQLPGFLFALQAGTPTGTGGVRGRAAGGVRV